MNATKHYECPECKSRQDSPFETTSMGVVVEPVWVCSECGNAHDDKQAAIECCTTEETQ